MADNLRILWVDDALKDKRALRDRNLLEADLRDQGLDVEVITLSSPSDILVSEVTPVLRGDLVIFDWRYQGSSVESVDVLEAFSRRSPSTPVLIYSVVREEEIAVTGNVRGVIEKPDWPALLKKIVEILARRPPTIIHLSDLHFGSSHGHGRRLTYESLWESLQSEIEGFLRELRPNVLVVSGDLTSRAARDEFKEARQFLGSLANALRIPFDNVLTVAGNHDVQLSEVFSYNNYFEEFVGKFYPDPRRIKRAHLYDKTGSEEEIEQDDIAWIRDLAGVAGTFVGLSSTAISTSEEHIIKAFGKGTIGNVRTSQLNKLSRRLQHFDAKASVRFAILHHQLFPVPSRVPGDGGDSLSKDDDRVVMGQASLLNWLSKNYFQVVLHGHSHFPAARTVATHYAGRWKQTGIPVNVFAAGTMGAASTPKSFPDHHYSVLRVASSGEGELALEQRTRILPSDGDSWRSEERMSTTLPLKRVEGLAE